MKKIQKKHLHVLFTGLGILAGVPALAFSFDPGQTLLNGTTLSGSSVVTMVFNIIKALLELLGILALLLVMYGGFTWMTAAGNDEKVKKGRDILLWAFLGLLIIMSSLGIVIYLDSTITKVTAG